MQQKALEYLEAGSRLVWHVDPAERTVAVYRSRSFLLVGPKMLPELPGAEDPEGGVSGYIEEVAVAGDEDIGLSD